MERMSGRPTEARGDCMGIEHWEWRSSWSEECGVVKAEGLRTGEMGLEFGVTKSLFGVGFARGERGEAAMVDAMDGVALATGEGRGTSV